MELESTRYTEYYLVHLTNQKPCRVNSLTLQVDWEEVEDMQDGLYAGPERMWDTLQDYSLGKAFWNLDAGYYMEFGA